jgi:hypothetical protein
MKKTSLALASVSALVFGAATPAAAQSGTFVPTLSVLGPSYAYFPAYYIYVPNNRAASAVDYGAAPSRTTRYVWFDDAYPPAIYGPRLRPIGR